MAVRKPSSADPLTPKLQLGPAMIRRGIERLDERIDGLQRLNLAGLTNGRSSELTAMEAAILETLTRCFGERTAAFLRYSRAAKLRHVSMAGARTQFDYTTPTKRNVAEAIALLQEAKRALGEDLIDIEHSSQASLLEHSSAVPSTNRVFVVHGHDEAALQGLARFLEKMGLEAIILREQPDQGRTIIEKFEASSDGVGFAVVLMTPDDIGGAVAAETSTARARQNVIFELGYFAGILGRGRVCLLRKGKVEIPSDLYGVIYTDMDAAEGWQTKLVKEMKAAKLDFDANRLWD